MHRLVGVGKMGTHPRRQVRRGARITPYSQQPVSARNTNSVLVCSCCLKSNSRDTQRVPQQLTQGYQGVSGMGEIAALHHLPLQSQMCPLPSALETCSSSRFAQVITSTCYSSGTACGSANCIAKCRAVMQSFMRSMGGSYTPC